MIDALPGPGFAFWFRAENVELVAIDIVSLPNVEPNRFVVCQIERRLGDFGVDTSVALTTTCALTSAQPCRYRTGRCIS